MRKTFLIVLLLFFTQQVVAAPPQQDNLYPTPGDYENTLLSDGIERRFLLHIPPSYTPDTPMPLVISFHGYTDTPDDHSQYTRLIPKADLEGFIAVFPEGQGDPPGWYTYKGAERDWANDVLFTRELIEHLQEHLAIDPLRIFAAGMSNGGGMAGRVGCDLSDIVAAIAPVSGNHVYNDVCEPLRPVPVLAIHGRQDEVAPYEGQSTLLANIPEWTLQWVERNKCDTTPVVDHGETVSDTFQSNILIETYTNCDDNADVILYTYESMGHSWPALTAADLIWDFFKAHPLPEKYLGTLEPRADENPPTVTLQIPPGEYVGTVPEWNRDYFLHVPPSYSVETSMPLVISFHDFGSNPIDNAEFTGLSDKADEIGFLAVFPAGSGNPLSFNIQATVPEGFPDDVRMTSDLIAYLGGQLNISEIFVVGFSLGGGMAHRIACNLSEEIDGVAMVNGGYFVNDLCEPARPVPIFAVHSQDNAVVPFEGSEVTMSIPEWINQWATRNSCDAIPTTTLVSENLRTEIWGNCAAPLVFNVYTTMGHSWPEEVDDMIWDFFVGLNQIN